MGKNEGSILYKEPYTVYIHNNKLSSLSKISDINVIFSFILWLS